MGQIVDAFPFQALFASTSISPAKKKPRKENVF